jgi:integrase
MTTTRLPLDRDSQVCSAWSRHTIRLHDVRHSYTSAALAAGVPAKVVSERLGHANIAITMDTYSRVLPGLDEQAAGQVARLILGAGDPGSASAS